MTYRLSLPDADAQRHLYTDHDYALNQLHSAYYRESFADMNYSSMDLILCLHNLSDENILSSIGLRFVHPLVSGLDLSMSIDSVANTRHTPQEEA
jgi:hypothetical protein